LYAVKVLSASETDILWGCQTSKKLDNLGPVKPSEQQKLLSLFRAGAACANQQVYLRSHSFHPLAHVFFHEVEIFMHSNNF